MHAGEALGRATANPTVLSSARGQVPRRCCSAASEARGGCASPSSFSGLSSRGARPRSFSLPESFGKVGQQRRRSKQAFSGCIAGVGPEEHVAGWTLSELDYPRGLVVLGLEVRMHSVKGAPVDTSVGDFVRPGMATKIPEFTKEEVVKAVQKIVGSFNWKGAVGISVTRQVWRALGGRDAARTLVAALPSCKGQVATMIHTEAAAHCEMAYGAGLGRMGRVLTVTVGAGLGSVLYHDGARTPTDLNHLTWTFAGDLTKIAGDGGWAGSLRPPEEFNEGVAKGELQGSWGAYVALLDKYIAKVLKATDAESVILLPTGEATAVPWETGILPHLVTVASTGAQVLIESRPEGSLVKGAARGASEEINGQQGCTALAKALAQKFLSTPRPEAMTGEQLAAAFALLVGKQKPAAKPSAASAAAGAAPAAEAEPPRLDIKSIDAAAALLKVPLTPLQLDGILRRMAAPYQDTVDLEYFSKWWAMQVDQVKVQTIRSEGELAQALAEASAAGEANEPDAVATVVLCVGSSTCRPCHKFEPTFYEMAARHPAARFLRVNADAGPAALDLVANSLKVESTPQFIFYSRGKEAERVQGGNVARFEAALQGTLLRSREGPAAAQAAGEAAEAAAERAPAAQQSAAGEPAAVRHTAVVAASAEAAHVAAAAAVATAQRAVVTSGGSSVADRVGSTR